jgi:hypothetical protein
VDHHRRHDHEDVDLNRHSNNDAALFPCFFSDVFDPFNTTRSLSQVLHMMDHMLDNPRQSWDAKEDNDALYIRVDMPGLGKEHPEQIKVEMTNGVFIVDMPLLLDRVLIYLTRLSSKRCFLVSVNGNLEVVRQTKSPSNSSAIII